MKFFSRFNKILLLFLVFFWLFFTSQQAHAFIDIPANFADMALGALDFIDKIFVTIVYILMLCLGSAAFITFSAKLLDWASTLPVGLADNSLVNLGWGFLAGFANIVFILIFIAIAFSYILKLETFGMKKALPRLIIMAFLINFSLLFVKMFVDVGWLAQNSFKLAFFQNNELAGPVAKQVGDTLAGVVEKYFLSIFPAYFVAAFIPFVNAAAQIGLVTLIIGGGLLSELFMGTFSQAIMLISFGLIGGVIFLTYAILFLARIAVIWLLAIAAPLAFAAWILPQTQKYFTQWLKHLFQWTFLGVVVFFLMGLGLRLFAGLSTGTDITARGMHLTVYYSRFIFFLIYMAICLGAAKKFTPAGAQAVWAIAEKAAGFGTAYAATQARRWTMKGRAWVGKKSAESLAKPSREMLALRNKIRTEKMTFPEREKLAQEYKGLWEKRKGKREMFEAQQAVSKGMLIQEQKSEYLKKTKGMDEATEKAWLLNESSKRLALPKISRNKDKSSALMELLAEKDAIKNNESHRNLYEEGWKNAGPDDPIKNRVKKATLSRMPNWGTDKELDALEPKWNTGTIEKMTNDAKEDDRIIERVVKTLRAELINRLGSSTGKASEKVQIEIDKTIGEAWRAIPKSLDDFKEYLKSRTDEQQKVLLKQLDVIRYLHNSPSAEIQTWKKYGSVDKQDRKENVNEFIKILRRSIK